jgi:membrane protease YdiL (CAAX protease family)
MTVLSAFPSDHLMKTKKLIDYLRAEEIELKKNGAWEEKDYLQYTALLLHKIDRLIYKSNDFSDFKELKELARAEIGDHRLAVVIEAELGIYELEPYLNRIYGESLVLVILKKAEGLYTLRRLDPFMPVGLNTVYQKLNAMDPDVSCKKNGRKWGGSDDIGGSPRGAATKLTPQEIAQACRDAFQKTGFVGHAIHFFHALVIVAAILGAAEICKFYFTANFYPEDSARANLLLVSDLSFFAALAFFAALSLAIVSRTRWWRFGIRIPTGKDWWLLLPIIMLAAFAQGVYFPQKFFLHRGSGQSLIYLILTIPLALELLFRSLAHGILAKDATIQSCRSKWFLSYPTVASAILYAAFIAYLVLLPDILHGSLQMKVVLICVLAAIAFGLTAGIIRERSQSVFPVILLHAAAITVFVFFNSI